MAVCGWTMAIPSWVGFLELLLFSPHPVAAVGCLLRPRRTHQPRRWLWAGWLPAMPATQFISSRAGTGPAPLLGRLYSTWLAEGFKLIVLLFCPAGASCTLATNGPFVENGQQGCDWTGCLFSGPIQRISAAGSKSVSFCRRACGKNGWLLVLPIWMEFKISQIYPVLRHISATESGREKSHVSRRRYKNWGCVEGEHLAVVKFNYPSNPVLWFF